MRIICLKLNLVTNMFDALNIGWITKPNLGV